MSQAPSVEHDDDQETAPDWTRWITIGSLAVGVAALVLTVWSVGWHKMVGEMKDVGWAFAAVIGIEAVITSMDAAAIHGFLGHGGRRPGYWLVLRAQVAGRAINVVTPGGSLGEATKATMLMEATSTNRAIGAVIRYNIASLGMTLAAIGGGAPVCAFTLHGLPPWMFHSLWIGGAVAVGLMVLGGVLMHRGLLASVNDVLARIHIIPRKRKVAIRKKLQKIDKYIRGHGTLRERWGPALWVVISRSLTWVSMWTVLVALDHPASVGTMAALATAGPLIGVVSAIIPLGLGVTEGGYAALFRALGEDAALGVTLTLARRVTMVIFAAIGLVLVASDRAVGSVRHRSKRA